VALVSSVVRVGRMIITAGAFAAFYSGAAILSWILLPLLTRGEDRLVHRALCSQALVRRAFILFHDFMRVCRLLDFDPRRDVLRLPEGACVVVANHPTLVDVTALIAAGGPMCVVAKPELSNSIAFGRLLRHCWHIDVSGDDGLAASSVVGEAMTRLQAGLRVLIFPEGTRSPEGGLGRFHRGAFQIAAWAGVPVVPLFLRCDPPVLSKTAPWYRAPRIVPHLSLQQLPTLLPESWPNAAAMAAAVRAGYGRLLQNRAFGLDTAEHCAEQRTQPAPCSDQHGHCPEMLLRGSNMDTAEYAIAPGPGERS